MTAAPPLSPFAVLSAAAYLVLGERGHYEVCLLRSAAEDHAVAHHGVVVELVRRDEVEELLAWRRWIGPGSPWRSL